MNALLKFFLIEQVKVDLITSGGNLTGSIPMQDVFLWVRTAGEFVKYCSSHVVGSGQQDEVSALSELCTAYEDPDSREKTCQELVQDPECTADGTMDVNRLLVQAVTDAAIRESLCELACWPDISRVYSAIFQQWAHFDPSVAHMLDLTKMSCAVDYLAGTLHVDLRENNTVQGLENVIYISMRANLDLPRGTRITLTGINGKSKDPKPTLEGSAGSHFTVVSWQGPSCSQWCPSSGLCPDGRCSAKCGAQGMAPDHRCVQWCEVDGEMVIEQSARALPAHQSVELSFEVVNPSVRQAPKDIKVEACAPGLALDIMSGGVSLLTAREEASFTFFEANPLSCECSSSGK